MKPSPRDISEAVAEVYGVHIRDLMEERARRWAKPRQVAMFLAREMSGVSWPKIGRHFRKDHTTALYAYRAVLAAVQAGADITPILASAALATARARLRAAQERALADSLHRTAPRPYSPVRWPQVARPIVWLPGPSQPRRVMVPAKTNMGP